MNNLKALVQKEIKQIMADRSVFALVFLLPVLLVCIYGSAVRMEAKPVSLAICCTNNSELNHEIISEFSGSEYFKLTTVPSITDGEKLLSDNEVKALLILPDGLIPKNSLTYEFMLYLNGVESQQAAIAKNYIENTINIALKKINQEYEQDININIRNYFNEKGESVFFLMSGQYVSIITLLCTFLGSFVIAREWDRGTIESLCITNAKAWEIVIAKVAVYYILTLWAVMIVLIVGQLFYQLPIRGSVAVMFVSLCVYALEILCLGILLSAKLKNQFAATQIAVVIGFLPTVMLSGLIFDLKAVSPFIHLIGIIIPPTYEVKAMRISFMSGGSMLYLCMNLLIQLFWCALFLILTIKQVKKDCK